MRRENHDTAIKGMLLVVASFLLIVLIYSSITEVDLFAKPPPKVTMTCYKSTPTAPGAASAETCCQYVSGMSPYCSKCQYRADGSALSCINFYPSGLQRGSPSAGTALPPSLGTVLPSSGNNTGLASNGQTGPPNHLGTVLPSVSNNNTGTPPALTVTKEHNTASPNALSSAGNTGNPNTNTGHHHKNEQNGGGTASTGNTQSGSTNNNPSSGEGNNGKSDNSNNNENSKK